MTGTANGTDSSNTATTGGRTIGTRDLLVASNRGPLSLSVDDDGRDVVRRGGGGLVSGMQSAMSSVDGVWICAALTDHERQVAGRAPDGHLGALGIDTGGIDVRMLPIDEDTFTRAYNGIANSTLWFVNHLLYDIPNSPVFDAAWHEQWQAYRDYDEAFATALSEEAAEGATVLVQDYHLVLTPRMLREQRPDLKIGHFTHTPWAPPEYFTMLPDAVARAVLTGMLGADHAGFLCTRWADAFVDCCAAVLSADVSTDEDGTRTVHHDGGATRIGIHPLGTDKESLRDRAGQDDVAERKTELAAVAGGRRVITRVDRTELSKNIARGLLAYRELLRTHHEWVGNVVHIAYAYPSRTDIPEYRNYTSDVERIGAEINEEFGTDEWTPLVLAVTDDYPGSLAAFQLAEVLVVNPVRDGMNLVAKEGPLLSEPGCALILSREAGALDELADDALVVNPYDVSETAEAMHAALSMDSTERRERCARLAAAGASLPPAAWFRQQVAALRA